MSSRVARLASVDPSGKAHLIPVCYVYRGGCFYTPIDKKPKTVDARDLKRVRNISGNPNVSLLIDTYYEDWSRLYYLIIRGKAEIIGSGREYEDVLHGLCAKYDQYKKMRLGEAGLPVIKISPERINAWGKLHI